MQKNTLFLLSVMTAFIIASCSKTAEPAPTVKDIYVCGVQNGNPTYWKNGIATSFVKDSRYENAPANAITLVGNDVYVIGSRAKVVNYSIRSVAKYWKNGVGTSLSDGKRIRFATDVKGIYYNKLNRLS